MGYSNGRHRSNFPMKNFNEAKRHLDEYLQRNSKKKDKNNLVVGHNTWLFHSDFEGSYNIQHHRTNIVSYMSDGQIVLRNGGWRTQQTKSRIETYTPFRIGSGGGEWYVHTQYGVFLFKDGISFMSDGRPVENAIKIRDAA